MKSKGHKSAGPSHYNKEASSYDAFNEKSSEAINRVIEGLLAGFGVRSVLDMTCGTGSQVFWLVRRGYDVVGADINGRMLKIAKDKSKAEKLDLRFTKGDMRSLRVGEFDAVVTIFNAVGHLTKTDFEEAMRNVGQNLKVGGIYIFDIFNLSYLLKGANITKLTIDWLEVVGNKKVREIQYSTIDEDGVLASYDTYYEQQEGKPPRVSKSSQTLQVYKSNQLRDMLNRTGFDTLDQLSIDGTPLVEDASERILTIARKR